MKKKLLIILCIAVVLITSAFLFIKYTVLKSKDFEAAPATNPVDLKPSLKAHLQQLVKDGSRGIYRLDLDSLNTTIANGSIKLYGMRLTPDSAVLNSIRSRQADDIVSLHINELDITGIDLATLITAKHIRIRSITGKGATVEVFHKSNPAGEIDEKLSQISNSFTIDKISLTDSKLIYHNLDKKNKISQYDNISVHASNFNIDSSVKVKTNTLFNAEKLDIKLPYYSLRTNDNLYDFNCGPIHMSFPENTITVRDLELRPRFNKHEFQKRTGERRDRLEIKVPFLKFSGADIKSFFGNKVFIAQQAVINGAKINDYIDRSSPPKTFKSDNYPQQSIHRIPFLFSVRLLTVNDMTVTYQEYNPISAKEGILYFDNIDATARNITNIEALIQKSGDMLVNGTAIFMKQVPVKVDFRFKLNDQKTGSFTGSLNAGRADHKILNPVSEPLAMTRLKRGVLTKAVAHFTGSNHSIHGKCEIHYDDLYIIPLQRDDDEKDSIDTKTVTAFLGNLIKLKESNPDEGDLRTFEYDVPRRQYVSFFTHIWKAMLAGLIKTINAPDKYAL